MAPKTIPKGRDRIIESLQLAAAIRIKQMCLACSEDSICVVPRGAD